MFKGLSQQKREISKFAQDSTVPQLQFGHLDSHGVTSNAAAFRAE
jgi:hypothetical protein